MGLLVTALKEESHFTTWKLIFLKSQLYAGPKRDSSLHNLYKMTSNLFHMRCNIGIIPRGAKHCPSCVASRTHNSGFVVPLKKVEQWINIELRTNEQDFWGGPLKFRRPHFLDQLYLCNEWQNSKHCNFLTFLVFFFLLLFFRVCF